MEPTTAELGTATVTGELSATVEQPTTDTWTVRIVVLALAVIALAIVAGNVALQAADRGSLPESLNTLAATCVGALGALLASTRSLMHPRRTS